MKKSPKKSKRLQLLAHKHTAKLTHRSHTSYPLLTFLLLIVGVFLALTTISARAADVTVTAVNAGSPPPYAAVITSPKHNARLDRSIIDVSGTCPYQYFVKLYRNNVFSGAMWCEADGTFSIQTSLFNGRNDLEARIFNVADTEGPHSSVVTVWYTPKSPGRGASIPFYLTTDYFYKAAYTGQKTTWDFTIYGGSGPYQAMVDWGDGTTSTHSTSDKKLSIDHTYQALKSEREYFKVIITLRDKNGRSTSLQLIAIMNEPDVIGGALARPNDPSPSGSWFSGILRYLWSAYLITLLMGVSFWLGERRGEGLQSAWKQPKFKTR
ncbi:MAG: hypothetical protein M3Q14_00635 [bacterium]|nr:hypothetical protein [bacterium]